MATKKAGQSPIRLDFQSETQVIVVPDDKDRFITTAGEAARACQQAENGIEWNRQWQEFLSYLNNWCRSHKDSISACYVSVGDSEINVLLCTSFESYNFDLEDVIAELDIDLATHFPVVSSEVIQIPNQPSLTSELPATEAVLVYGDGCRTSPASAT